MRHQLWRTWCVSSASAIVSFCLLHESLILKVPKCAKFPFPSCGCSQIVVVVFLRKMCNTRNLLFVMWQWERYPYASPSVRCLSLTLNLDLQPPSFFLFSNMQKLKKTHRVQAFYAGGCKPKAVNVCAVLWIICPVKFLFTGVTVDP